MFDYRRDPEPSTVHVLPFTTTGHYQNRECCQSRKTDTAGDLCNFLSMTWNLQAVGGCSLGCHVWPQ